MTFKAWPLPQHGQQCYVSLIKSINQRKRLDSVLTHRACSSVWCGDNAHYSRLQVKLLRRWQRLIRRSRSMRNEIECDARSSQAVTYTRVHACKRLLRFRILTHIRVRGWVRPWHLTFDLLWKNNSFIWLKIVVHLGPFDTSYINTFTFHKAASHPGNLLKQYRKKITS